MASFLSQTRRTCETHAAWLLAAGLGVSFLYHARRWQADRLRADRLRGGAENQPAPLRDHPLVSILLPAWNEAGFLQTCIESILALRYPNVELVICAGGEDGSFAIARYYERPGVIVLEQHPGQGKQVALQRCYEHSKGDLIYLTDADCQVDDQCFERTLAPLINTGEMVATGAWQPFERQLSHPLVLYQWSHHLYREAWLPDYPGVLDGRNAAVRRQVLEKAGAFRVAAPTGTDYVLSKALVRLGFRILFVPASRVQTDYPETIPHFLRQRSRWFRTPLIQGRRWGDRALVRMVLRAGLLSWGMLLLTLLAPFSRCLRLAWLGALGHQMLGHLRVDGTARRTTPRYAPSPWKALASLVCLPVGWLSTTNGLFQSLFPQHKIRW